MTLCPDYIGNKYNNIYKCVLLPTNYTEVNQVDLVQEMCRNNSLRNQPRQESAE